MEFCGDRIAASIAAEAARRAGTGLSSALRAAFFANAADLSAIVLGEISAQAELGRLRTCPVLWQPGAPCMDTSKLQLELGHSHHHRP